MANTFIICMLFRFQSLLKTHLSACYNITSVQSLSRVWLFATPWTAACPGLSVHTNSQSLLKLLSIESVMPSNHLIFCHPLLLPPSIFPSIRVFSNESYTRKPPLKKKMMVVGNLLGWWACGGAGRVALSGEHGRSMPLPTRLALVSLSSGCSRVLSFYDQPVI